MIGELFSELLKSRGISTRILSRPEEFSELAPHITEPQFFRAAASARCLVVGNKETLKGLDAVILSRPLTEEKIEQALSEFLKPAI